jgi:hypothetical protein
MKRLLLSLLAVIALPTSVSAFFGNKNEDIIIKTDLNEEYIVKDSTVTITPFSKKKAIAALQKTHPIALCLRIREFAKNSCWEDLYSEKTTAHLNLENILINSDISTPINLIKFRPIFVDLNGTKSANTYYNIACINFDEIGKMNSNDSDDYIKSLAPLLAGIKADIPDFNSGLAIESLKEAVCKKYNVFEDSDFSIDDPEVIKRKYYSGFQFVRNQKNGKFIVVNVVNGSDAQNYLKKDDEILKVNDIDLSSVKTVELALEAIYSGDRKDQLKILVKRKREELEFLIKREMRY